MSSAAERFLCLRFHVERAAEELFLLHMSDLGTAGLEQREEDQEGAEYLAYFRLPADRRVKALSERQDRWPGVRLQEVSELPVRDWLQLYRQQARPFGLAGRWWVDPREPGSRQVAAPAGRRALLIPAWTAFGTGTHESTSLMVELLEGLRLDSKTVLDLGTGTGILAMVALASGAAAVTALDVDPVAAFVAGQTCRLNGMRPRLVAGRIESLRAGPEPRFDVAIANIVPSLLRPDLSSLLGQVRPGGQVLLSGMLVAQEADVRADLTARGLEFRRRLGNGDWVALHMEKGNS